MSFIRIGYHISDKSSGGMLWTPGKRLPIESGSYAKSVGLPPTPLAIFLPFPGDCKKHPEWREPESRICDHQKAVWRLRNYFGRILLYAGIWWAGTRDKITKWAALNLWCCPFFCLLGFLPIKYRFFLLTELSENKQPFSQRMSKGFGDASPTS